MYKERYPNEPFGYFPVNPRGFLNPCFECGTETKGTCKPVPKHRGGTKVLPLCHACKEKTYVIPERYREARRQVEIKQGLRSSKSSKVTTPELIEKVRSLRAEGYSLKRCADELRVGYGTVQSIAASCAPPAFRKPKKDGYGKCIQVYESFSLAETTSE